MGNPGRRISAREKLAAFERQQQGNNALFVRVGILFVLLLLVFVALFFIGGFQDSQGWRGVPRQMAKLINLNQWAELQGLAADDLVVEGGGVNGAVEALEGLKRLAGSGTFHVSHPYEVHSKDGECRLDVLVTLVRGDLTKAETIPLVTTWGVRLEMLEEGDEWKLRRVAIRTMLPGALPGR